MQHSKALQPIGRSPPRRRTAEYEPALASKNRCRFPIRAVPTKKKKKQTSPDRASFPVFSCSKIGGLEVENGKRVACYPARPTSSPDYLNLKLNAWEANQMSLFRCSKCGCGEETALCNYWSIRVRDGDPLCSACDPKIGKWHGEFPRDAFALRHANEIERFLAMSWAHAPKPRRSAVA